MRDTKCYLCDFTASQLPTDRDGEIINCLRCSKYFISRSLIESNDELKRGKDRLYKVSSWVYEQNHDFNTVPELRTNNFIKLLEMRDKKVKEKFDTMMQCIYTNQLATIDTNKCVVQSWFKNENEFLIFFQKAIDDGLVKAEIQRFIDRTTKIQFQNMTYDGQKYVEELEEPNQSSKNVFLAFNFEMELNNIFSIYVKEAVEESGLNYVIVNQNTTEHDKSITDEIIGKLKSSRIVIADFTNHRNSVYFEAGFAMGMKIPIIWTVQKGHEDDISFDTRQYPHIVWENGEDLKKQIMDRIKVIL